MVTSASRPSTSRPCPKRKTPSLKTASSSSVQGSAQFCVGRSFVAGVGRKKRLGAAAGAWPFVGVDQLCCGGWRFDRPWCCARRRRRRASLCFPAILASSNNLLVGGPLRAKRGCLWVCFLPGLPYDNGAAAAAAGAARRLSCSGLCLGREPGPYVAHVPVLGGRVSIAARVVRAVRLLTSVLQAASLSDIKDTKLLFGSHTTRCQCVCEFLCISSINQCAIAT